MNQEVTAKQKVLIMRSGIQIWIDEKKAEFLLEILSQPQKSKMIRYEGQLINTADVIGLFDVKTIESWTKKQNGNWQCRYNQWHTRGEKCSDLCIINSVTPNSKSNFNEKFNEYKRIIFPKIKDKKSLTFEERGLNEQNQIKLDYPILRRILPNGHPDIHNEIDIGGQLESIMELQKKLSFKGVKTQLHWYSLRYKAYIAACKELMISTQT